MRRLTAATTVAVMAGGLGLGMLVAACGPSGAGSLGKAPTGSPHSSTSTGPSASPSPSTTAPEPPGTSPTPPTARLLRYQVWWVRDLNLVTAERTGPATPATSRLALTSLMAGPTPAETAAGVGTLIPPHTRFTVSVRAGVATVDLPGSFYSGVPLHLLMLRKGQVVFTLTQFPTVTSVVFLQNGVAHGTPLARSDYDSSLPPIVVTEPAVDQRVSSPVHVAGSADVFEATVNVRILDAAGNEIATRFTTATCGSGCRGRYAVDVAYRVTTEQRGTVEVYEVSAENGSRTNVVSIPVILTP